MLGGVVLLTFSNVINLPSPLLPHPLARALLTLPRLQLPRGAYVHHEAVIHAAALLTHLASDISPGTARVTPRAPTSSSPRQTDTLHAGWTYSSPPLTVTHTQTCLAQPNFMI